MAMVLTKGRCTLVRLLGYELGDRHHSGNLESLSSVFGIHPRADIVGPPGHGPTHPYGVPVDFEVSAGDPIDLTANLSAIHLSNVQTLYVEPGGTEWLRVGKNVVCRPVRQDVVYLEGSLQRPGTTRWDLNRQASWVSVAVDAPQGLCGNGSVRAIGTWDLLGRAHSVQDQDNLILVKRLLGWLSHCDSPR